MSKILKSSESNNLPTTNDTEHDVEQKEYPPPPPAPREPRPERVLPLLHSDRKKPGLIEKIKGWFS